MSDVVRRLERAVVPPVGERGVGETVGEDRTDPSLLEPADRLVGVIGRVLDVRPVEQCRHTGVDTFERAHVVGDVYVLWSIDAREAVEHDSEIVVESSVGCGSPDRCLPGVAVRVDEAGDHDIAGDIDYLRIRRLDLRCNRGDGVALNKDVAPVDIADLGINTDDVTPVK